MTTKLSVKLAIGMLAALAFGAAPIADALESAARPAPPQTAESAAAQPGFAGAAAAGSAAESAAPAIPSPSTPVSGMLTDPHGQPLARVELHFQGRVDPDIFTVRTRANGSFSTALPPGTYDLRDEHGAIIAEELTVGRSAVSLGQLESPAPLAPTRLFDRQEIGEVIVKTPAPSGAYVPAPGEAPTSVAVMPIANPLVQGGAAGGKPMAPAQVVPMGIEQQLQVPPGAETTVGVPPFAGEMPAPTAGVQSEPAMRGIESAPQGSPAPAGGY
jgi:hypothetical protein